MAQAATANVRFSVSEIERILVQAYMDPYISKEAMRFIERAAKKKRRRATR
jgi:hypothetical protein